MHVLQVTTTAELRGAEVFARDLGRELNERGHRVETLSIEASTGAAMQFEQLAHRRTDPRSIWELSRRATNFDLLVAHGGSTLAPVAVCAKLARRPFVYRNIGDPHYWGRTFGASVRIGLPLRQAAHVMALYPQAASYMEDRYRIARSRVTVAPNAVDVSAFLRASPLERRVARALWNLSDKDLVIGYLGSLSQEKRPDLAIEVADRLPEATLLIAGAGPMREDLQHLCETRNRRRRRRATELIGAIENPREFLAALDALLIPSTTEGIPGVLLEAALVGIPVVASAVGGVPDTLDHLGVGIGVNTADPSDFAEAVADVTNAPEVYRTDAETVASTYGLKAVAGAWESTLENIVAAS